MSGELSKGVWYIPPIIIGVACEINRPWQVRYEGTLSLEIARREGSDENREFDERF